jgi:glycosyltransferase involved in cell wall biosynthesis
MKYRICLDIRITQKSSRFTGTGIYAARLAEALLNTESRFEFYFLVLKGQDLPFTIPEEKLIKVWRPKKPESFVEIYDLLNLNFILKKYKINLFHSLVPGFVTPGKGVHTVVTIHDIIPDILPEEKHQSKLANLLYKTRMTCALKADKLITNSHATSRDLTSYYGIDINKIRITYFASQFGNDNYPIKNSQENIKQYQPYFLYLGGFNYRKNVINVLKAFSIVSKEMPEVNLLIAGIPSKEQWESLDKIQHSLNCAARIKWMGFVPDYALPILYKSSLAFLYPSRYEGFGLPVLEAMENEAPVITSNKGSIPEIIADCGLITDPENVEELVDNMKLLVSDVKLRDSLITKARIRSGFFSWDNCAVQTLECYNEILIDANRN